MNFKCNQCQTSNGRLRRGYCNNCYRKLMRCGDLIKLPIVPMPAEITDFQHEILIGSMLGDGCLHKQGNAVFIIRRSLKDREYLLWQYDFFKDFCMPNPIKIRDTANENGKIYKTIEFRTRASSLFTKYYNEWYLDGTKIVSKKLLLTPTILLIWFLDDGCVSIRSANSFQIKLSTNGFLKEDVEHLIDLLIKLTNEHFNLIKQDGKYVILGCGNAAAAYLRIIKDIFPSCMNRKITWTNDYLYKKYPLSKNGFPAINIKELLLKVINANVFTSKMLIEDEKVFTDERKDRRYVDTILNKWIKNENIIYNQLSNRTKIYTLTEKGKISLGQDLDKLENNRIYYAV